MKLATNGKQETNLTSDSIILQMLEEQCEQRSCIGLFSPFFCPVLPSPSTGFTAKRIHFLERNDWHSVYRLTLVIRNDLSHRLVALESQWRDQSSCSDCQKVFFFFFFFRSRELWRWRKATLSWSIQETCGHKWSSPHGGTRFRAQFGKPLFAGCPINVLRH